MAYSPESSFRGKTALKLNAVERGEEYPSRRKLRTLRAQRVPISSQTATVTLLEVRNVIYRNLACLGPSYHSLIFAKRVCPICEFEEKLAIVGLCSRETASPLFHSFFYPVKFKSIADSGTITTEENKRCNVTPLPF